MYVILCVCPCVSLCVLFDPMMCMCVSLCVLFDPIMLQGIEWRAASCLRDTRASNVR